MSRPSTSDAGCASAPSGYSSAASSSRSQARIISCARRWRFRRLLAGMCARQRTYFLLRRQKKVSKGRYRGSLTSRSEVTRTQKATPLAVSLRFAAGNLRCSGAGRCCGTRCALAHFAQTTAASQSTKHGHAALPMPAPRPALLGTARGVGEPHSGHRCARPRQTAKPGSSAAMARVVFNPLWLRLRRSVCGVARAPQDARVRALTRGGCLSEAPWRVASSTAHPANAVTQVCPGAKRRGRRLGVAFCVRVTSLREVSEPRYRPLPTFFWRRKRK